MTIIDLPPSMLRLCAVLLGLVWGSFLNVVIYRLPRGQSVVRPPSNCPGCHTPISARHNIPVFSWLLLRGRAACCGAPISVRYPLIEALGAVGSVAVLEILVFPLPANTPVLHALVIYAADFALVLGLIAAAFIDLEHMLVPDSISLGGTVVGLITCSLRDVPVDQALLGAAIGFLIVWLPFDVIYSRLRGQVGMGLGDAKLTMMAGAWFGPFGALFALAAGAVQGTIATAVMWLVRGKPEEPAAVKVEREQLLAEIAALPEQQRAELERELSKDPLARAPEEGWGKARIAFGPFLILATLECLLLGPDRIMGYLFG